MDELKRIAKMIEIALNELTDKEEKEIEVNCKIKRHPYDDNEEDYVYTDKNGYAHDIECVKIVESDVKLEDNIIDKKFYKKEGSKYPEFKVEIFITQIDDNHRKIQITVSDSYDIEEFEEYEYENSLIENLKESGHYY